MTHGASLGEARNSATPGGPISPALAALAAAAALPPPEPVPSVVYRSRGRTLVVGPANEVLPRAGELAATLPVTALVTDGTAGRAAPALTVLCGRPVEAHGYLGNFTVRWEPNAPLEASERPRSAVFDLILDLGEAPLFTMPQPPQGYFAPGRDERAVRAALEEIREAVGEFDKPKYFLYDASICAHSRCGLEGCDRCIEVCSTRAISAAGDRVGVDAHLCMGCGGCATVCPSGAMSYAFPKVDYQGDRIRAMLEAFHAAGGRAACLLLHDGSAARLIEALEQRAAVPERVIALPVHHIASVGLDLALGAIVLGANQCLVLSAATEPEAYRTALSQQLEYGRLLLEALGYGSRHLGLVVATDAAALEDALRALEPAEHCPPPAKFRLFDRKRTTLWFAIDHLAAHAPAPGEAVQMPAGAPFGAVRVNRESCTLCMACVGTCPENALLDGRDRPQLRFVEANCVQCGLCERACPEDAISLVPRVALGADAKREVVLNEDTPFRCIRCGKEFAATRVIDRMVGRLVEHPMFSSPEALRRLRMCADCRVVDLMQGRDEVSIFDLKP